MRRVGYLPTLAESDLEVQSWIRELVQRLQELSWTNEHNVQVDFRFSDADATRTSMLATELIELRSDVVLAAGAPADELMARTRSYPTNPPTVGRGVVIILVGDTEKLATAGGAVRGAGRSLSGSSFVFDCADDRRQYGAASASSD